MSAQNAATVVRAEHLEELTIQQSNVAEVETEINVGPARRSVSGGRRRIGFVAIFLLRHECVRATEENYDQDQHALRRKVGPTTARARALLLRSHLLPLSHLIHWRCCLWSDVFSAHALRLAEKFLYNRKSTRLNSSHGYISYAVFCLK